jgi:hypothetical protein
MMTVIDYNGGANSERNAGKRKAQTTFSRKRPGHLRVLSRQGAPSCSEVGRGGRQSVRYGGILERSLASSERSAPSDVGAAGASVAKVFFAQSLPSSGEDNEPLLAAVNGQSKPRDRGDSTLHDPFANCS